MLYKHARNGRIGLERCGHGLRINGLAPRNLDGGGFKPTRGGDFAPALAKFAAFNHQHALAGGKQAVHCRRHGTRAGTGEGQYHITRAEQHAQSLLNPAHHGFKFTLAVVDHVFGEHKTHALRQRRGAGGEQANFVQHGKSLWLSAHLGNETLQIGRFGHGSMDGMIRPLAPGKQNTGMQFALGGGMRQAAAQGLHFEMVRAG